MSEVHLGRGKTAQPLRLGKLLGEGAAGKVHAVLGQRGLAAKLYHGPAEAKRHEGKVDAMIAGPPDLPPAAHEGVRHPQIAWPEAKLYDKSGSFIGFLMPEIDFKRSTSLVNLLQKSSRRAEKLSDYYGYRVLVARNLASVFAELHRAGHHMIDMKPANLRFYPTVSWMAVVDTDGFSIAGKRGRLPAEQVSDEYIAPESWQKKPSELGEEQDLFALAVIIFQLLNNGLHPFAGSSGGRKGGEVTDLQGRIQAGLYAYALSGDRELAPSAASVHRMFPRETRQLLDRAFAGSGPRPAAAEWRDHLDLLIAGLAPCTVRPEEHAHFGSGCGFCGHEARVQAAARAAPARPRPAPRPKQAQGQAGRRNALALGPARPRGAPPPLPPGHHRRPQLWIQTGPARRALGWRGALLLVVGATALLSSDTVWHWLSPPSASPLQTASAAPVLDPAPRSDIAPFAQPRDYRILPEGGGVAADLRQGPGTRYPVVSRLRLHEDVIGRGKARAGEGASWVLVTRPSDGATGYIRETALLERERTPAELAAPDLNCRPGSAAARAPECDDPELAQSTARLGIRYRKLLARADDYDRVDLMQGQQQWEDERRRCEEQGDDRLFCVKRANARRIADLDAWIATEGVNAAPVREIIDQPGPVVFETPAR